MQHLALLLLAASLLCCSPAAAQEATPTPAMPQAIGLDQRVPFIGGPLPAPGSCHYQGNGTLPDPSPGCTPGMGDPRVTQGNLAETICNRNLRPTWSRAARPPTTYTDPLKRGLMVAYGVGDQEPADFELDHLWNIASGGHPTDWHNLWPQPYTGTWGAHVKDLLEVRVERDICDSTLTLAEAGQAETRNWRQAYDDLVAH